ncbi:MAG: LLM class flavin-dependent oxidoreductase [Candidatus Lokiarchaeota archaeon]|nr:LLM class flavin-dependent oxidoreductase [Candidatus Lokiarchaeota archaeon]
MRFGYVVRDPSNQAYSEIKALTVKVERLGFESVHVTDHFFSLGDVERKKAPFLESNVILAALATETHRIKLGHIVMCNSFRNPAYSAKVILTLDHISNGRVLLWLGAGWFRNEYEAYGYPFPSGKRRVDELEESLIIFKKVFTEDETNFEGNFWKLEKHINFPKSVQKPYPQIVVGTNNGKRMIDIACREADGVNLAYITPHDQKSFSESISIINEKLKRYGRDPTEFEISIYTYIRIVDSQEALERIRKEKGIFKSNMKYQFIGNVNAIQEKIHEVEKLGVEKMIVIVESPVIEDPISLFSKEIM